MMKQKDLDELMVQLEKESEPFGITNFYVERPCMACGCCYFILILAGVIAVLGQMMIPALGDDRDYGILDD